MASVGQTAAATVMAAMPVSTPRRLIGSDKVSLLTVQQNRTQDGAAGARSG
ncbi:hypothetical protein KCMC57_up16230 [Kitasatospora sp. CMC57]|uniref:Uncharacterized protein n=1 Tax=Kitasatospora sp. CMC57 TaxID=3231513 RepID=A0AB33K145_9ACTN